MMLLMRMLKITIKSKNKKKVMKDQVKKVFVLLTEWMLQLCNLQALVSEPPHRITSARADLTLDIPDLHQLVVVTFDKFLLRL